MADCGQLVSEVPEEEPTFDPGNVVIGQCGQDFPVEGAPGETRDVRVIATNTNEVDAVASIALYADAGPETQQIGGTTETLPALANTEVIVTITIPPEGSYSVRAEKSNVSQAAPASARHQRAPHSSERVRAGATRVENGQHRTVADGGANPEVARAGVQARTALARACGGCAERSRKLSASNRRLRNAFDVFGG